LVLMGFILSFIIKEFWFGGLNFYTR
jgi:hypothetical protein